MSSRLPYLLGSRRKTRRDSSSLPPPVTTATSPPPLLAISPVKRTTFEEPPLPSSLKVHWSKFKKRLGSGSNPSESVLEITDAGSEGQTRRGTHSDGRSYGAGMEDEKEGADNDEDDEEVDETVVHNSFAMLGASKSMISTPSEADGLGVPDRMGGSQSGTGTHAPPMTDMDSSHDHDRTTNCFVALFNLLRYRLWSGTRAFFFTSFHDPVAEAQYRRETYFQMKGLALSGSLFLIVNWVSDKVSLLPVVTVLTTSEQLLVLIVIQQSTLVLSDKIFYYGVRRGHNPRSIEILPLYAEQIAPVLLIPLPVMIMFDWPKLYPIIYQIWMSFTIFSWSAYCEYISAIVRALAWLTSPIAQLYS